MPAMTAAELRDRAIRHLASSARPTPQDIAEADVWSRLAVSAAISETGTIPVAGVDPS